MFQERRANKRHDVRQGAYGTFKAHEHSHYTLVGQILDISRGGVCIKYLSDGHGYRLKEVVHVELFCVDLPVTTGRIPCKVVYDVPVMTSPNSHIKIRKCGLKYDLPEHSQKFNLEHFIDACSRGKERGTHSLSLAQAVGFKSASLDG